MKLQILKKLPENILEISVAELHGLLQGPTLIHLEGEKKRPIFFSTLLHGNEHSSFLALQNVLRKKKPLARSMIIFIGNTLAAEKNLRHLPDQLDFNRIWSGGGSELASIAQEVLDYARKHDPLCCVDIHNNTGKNPFYSCTNRIDDRFFFLANFFSSKIVYFTEPHEVLSMAFSHFTPSITIEAGTSGEEKGVKILEEKIEGLLALDSIPEKIDRSDISVYHTFARMRFSPGTSIDFNHRKDSGCDYSLLNEIDALNFQKLKVGTSFGYTNRADAFWVQDNADREITDQYFDFKYGYILVKKSFIPAMMTQDLKVIEDDCFGYMMEEYPIE